MQRCAAGRIRPPRARYRGARHGEIHVALHEAGGRANTDEGQGRRSTANLERLNVHCRLHRAHGCTDE